MERPNKKEYDFNDVFEAVRFGANMIEYADYLENQISKGQKLPILSVVEPKGKVCKHSRIEEIQGGQIERCRDCGKQWG